MLNTYVNVKLFSMVSQLLTCHTKKPYMCSRISFLVHQYFSLLSLFWLLILKMCSFYKFLHVFSWPCELFCSQFLEFTSVFFFNTFLLSELLHTPLGFIIPPFLYISLRTIKTTVNVQSNIKWTSFSSCFFKLFILLRIRLNFTFFNPYYLLFFLLENKKEGRKRSNEFWITVLIHTSPLCCHYFEIPIVFWVYQNIVCVHITTMVILYNLWC